MQPVLFNLYLACKHKPVVKALAVLMLCTITAFASAQHPEEPVANDAHHAGHHKHQVQSVLSHTLISEGRDADDSKKWLALASWGINYNFHFDKRWSLGLHSDVILEDFKVRRAVGEETTIERKKPVALAAVGGYKFWGPFTALLGGGIEIESDENFGFIRLGLEPGWHFGGGKWEVSVIGTYEIKIEAYNSWMFGFGISRLF